jgi:hypothetical protein
MERLNWAVLGLIGIVTALGLGSSNSAGRPKSEEQPITVNTSTDAPACSACRSQVATSVATTPKSHEETCPGNCQATGVCCDKSLPKSETTVAAKAETHACEGECLSGKTIQGKAWVINGTGECKSVPGATTTTDCPTKAADALASLTKQYVCEGGACLTKKGHGTLTITAADPTVIELTAKPEGLSNLLAAAEATNQEPPAKAAEVVEVPADEITVTTEPILTTAEGLKAIEDLVKNKKNSSTTQSAEKEEPKTTDTKPAEKMHPIDNSRAAARAAKLAKIEKKLEAPWELEFDDAKLEDIAKLVQDRYNVPVIIDRKALEEAAFDIATPITATKQPEIEAGEYLRGMLNNLGLTWIIPPSSDRVLITTRTGEESIQIVRSYDVTELLENENDGTDQLISAVQSLVSPPTWKSNGGHGDLHAMRIDGRVKLVTANSYWVQRELHDFFIDLRAGTTSASKPANREDKHSSIRVYRLPAIASYLTNDPKFDPTMVLPDREKLVEKQKSMMQAVLAENPTFDPTVFQIYEYDYKPILVTKQTPSVHRSIERLLGKLDPQHNASPPGSYIGNVFGSGMFGD